MRSSVWIFLFVGFSAFSQHKVVTIPRPVEATYSSSQVEPSIAIHPKKKKWLVAGTVLNDYYFSKNGGKKWKSSSLKSPYGVHGDPVLTFDNKGRVYYFHLANPKKGSYLDRIVCQSAKKPNKPFNEGTFPAPNGTKVQDKPWVVVNHLNNEIYMTWTQFDKYNSADPKDSSIIVFSKSSNQGATWSKPLRISQQAGDCLDSNNTVEGAVPAVGPNGEIYVTWTGPEGLVFQKSLDGGKTWLPKEINVEKQYQGWNLNIPGMGRANGLPILKCDVSNGSNRGTLYLNFCDQKNGEDNTDVWLMTSKDGGETWSERRKVSRDYGKKHQFFTWIDIDQSNGDLYFVYYDRRNYADNQTDVYIAYSFDGGKTIREKKVSKTPFVPNPNVFFGDYLNIAANKGKIAVIWPRMDNKKISLKFSSLDKKDLKEYMNFVGTPSF